MDYLPKILQDFANSFHILGKLLHPKLVKMPKCPNYKNKHKPKNVKTFQNKQEWKQALKNKQVCSTKVNNILCYLANLLKLNKVHKLLGTYKEQH